MRGRGYPLPLTPHPIDEERSPSIILRNEAICERYGVDKSVPDLLMMELTPLIQYVVKEIVVRKGESSTPLLEYYQALSNANSVAQASKRKEGVSKARKKKNEVSLEDMEMTSLIMSLINYCVQTGIGKDQESADKAPLLILYDSVKFKYDWTLDIQGIGKLIISWQSFSVISSRKPQPLNPDDDFEGVHHRFIQIPRVLDKDVNYEGCSHRSASIMEVFPYIDWDKSKEEEKKVLNRLNSRGEHYIDKCKNGTPTVPPINDHILQLSQRN